jgi:hypothetical protein
MVTLYENFAVLAAIPEKSETTTYVLGIISQ